MLRRWEGSSPRGWAGLGSRPGPEQWNRAGRALCVLPTWHRQSLQLERGTNLMSSFTSHQGLIPTAAALSIPSLWSNHAHGAKPSSPGSPIPAFLPQDCALDRAPLPGGCTASWCPAPCPAPKEPAWAVRSQQLLLNTSDLWDPKSCPGCSSGVGEEGMARGRGEQLGREGRF